MTQPKITMTVEEPDKEKITYIVKKVSHSTSGITVNLGKRVEILGGAGGMICPRCHIIMVLQAYQATEDKLESTWWCHRCGYHEIKREKKKKRKDKL